MIFWKLIVSPSLKNLWQGSLSVSSFLLHSSMECSNRTSSSPPGRTGITHLAKFITWTFADLLPLVDNFYLGFDISSSSLVSLAVGKLSRSSWSVCWAKVLTGGGAGASTLGGGGEVGTVSVGSPIVILTSLLSLVTSDNAPARGYKYWEYAYDFNFIFLEWRQIDYFTMLKLSINMNEWLNFPLLKNHNSFIASQ